MSKDQQEVRDWLRGQWDRIIRSAVEDALQDAQEASAADEIADRLWPALPAGEVVRLDQADDSLLRCGKETVPASFTDHLEHKLFEIVTPLIEKALPGNKHARGGRLRSIVRQEVDSKRGIDEAIDWACRERDSDDFTRRRDLREMVLRRLSTRAAKEVSELAPTATDAEPKRRLKVLTALATPGGTPQSRAELLGGLTSGKTASFPYILKYIGPDAIPVIQTFSEQQEPTLDALPPSIVAKFPGADLVQECLQRYISRKSILSVFMDPDGDFAEPHQRKFEQLPGFIPRQSGGILMPKKLAASESRRERFRLPDGIACSLGLAILCESLLRQTVVAKKMGGPKNARGGELVTRVASQITLSRKTVNNLRVIFDQRSLSLRDAMAHAAFFADDEMRVYGVVGGLSQTLAALIADLTAANVLDDVLAAALWDEGRSIDPKDLALVDEQYGPGLNILDQMRDDDARAHVFKVLETATPDKRLLGSAGFLLWISGQRDEHVGKDFDGAQQFAALFGGLLALEELLRALYEADNQRVLRATPDGSVVRCHLAMLDDQPGELLDRSRLDLLFRHYGIDENCVRSFLAVKAIRDLAFHGCWKALPKPWARYTHLVMKLIFTLCSIAHFNPPPKAKSSR